MTGEQTSPIHADGEEISRRTHAGPLLRPTQWWRAAVFLCVNLCAYAFANSFVYALSSGQWFSTTAADYRDSIGRPLSAMLLAPLNIFTHPWMILITGLLLAVVVVVPLLVACLYHSRFCVFFLLCVMVLAHSPILAFVLGVGCILVAATPLRRRNPSLALLLGLVPAAVYLYLSASRSAVVMTPTQRLVLYVPFLTAAVGAVLAGGMILLIAHWARYRPGVIWPVVAVLLGVPGWVFYRHVGTDELAFAVLAGRLTATPGVFADQALPLSYGPSNRPLTMEEMTADVEGNLDRRKSRFAADCEDFILRYPQSRRLSAVLWIKGITEDTRISKQALDVGFIQHYDDVPIERSRETWQRLRDGFPTEGRSAIASLRLARLEIQASRLSEAAALLSSGAKVLKDVYTPTSAGRKDSWWSQVFSVDPGPPPAAYLQRVADQIAALRWLMEANHVLDDATAGAAFVAYVQFDPKKHRREDAYWVIVDLAERFAETPLADNFAMARAMNVANPINRAKALQDLADAVGQDTSIEANYELGRLAMQLQNIPGLGRVVERPEVYFKRVQSAVANPWQPMAALELARLAEKEAPSR